MNITQLEKEIIKAIKIESKEIGFLTDKHNEEKNYYGKTTPLPVVVGGITSTR